MESEKGFTDSDLVPAGERTGSSGGGDQVSVHLHRIARNQALDQPLSILVCHLRMKGLYGRMVKSHMVRRLTHLPSQGDLLVFRRVASLETDLLLNDVRDQRLQPSR
jgi:hypothetical protein